MGKQQKTLQNLFAGSQLFPYHPIMKEPEELRGVYYQQLERCITRLRWRKNEWVQAEMELYRAKLFANPLVSKRYAYALPDYYTWFLIMDLALISGYNMKCISSRKMKDLISRLCYGQNAEMQHKADCLLSVLATRGETMNKLNDREFGDYLSRIQNNISFIHETPYKILVTATMSAGKSSLVNALVGKEISRVENLACTDKIRLIIGKHDEDNLVYLEDNILTLDAEGSKMLWKNMRNTAKYATTSAFFRGYLGGARLILKDSPGVNSSMNNKHRKITEQEVKKRDYDLIIYVLNITQIGIDDDSRHLEYIKENIGKKDILFALNKIDELNPDRENLNDCLYKAEMYLKNKGFYNPTICPISAKTAFQARNSYQETLDTSNIRYMYLKDKLSNFKLREYYTCRQPQIVNDDGDNTLLEFSGVPYLEKIIMLFYLGVMNQWQPYT